MRRSTLYILLLVLLIAVALSSMLMLPRPAVSQSGATATSMFPVSMYGPEPFRVAGEIGRALPRRMIYDALSEQFALVDAYNRLLLMDARTYETRYMLHSDGETSRTNIVDMEFSHDGRYLAVINGLNVELWDTQNGTLSASLIAPGDPRQLVGPLDFSSQDQILLFYGIYPAPPALRRSENDSVTYPWVWHLAAARGEGASTLPNGDTAKIMYDYRSGFALTPDDRILASLPSRLVVLDALTLEPLYDIPTESYEQDALQVWASLDDARKYVFSGARSVLLQIDTTDGTVHEYPLNTRLPPRNTDVAIGRDVPLIPRSDLWHAFLTDERVNRTAALSLVDIIQPLDPAGGSTRALIYTREGSRAQFMLSSGDYPITQMALSPDGGMLLTREGRQNGEVIASYNIASGREIDTLTPSLRSPNVYERSAQNRVLAHDTAGETFLSDFQRYDAASFEVLAEDLRYSFRYDRFFFGREPGTMVTISGTEWRLWEISTNSVLRREVLAYDASTIQSISDDAYRILYTTESGLAVQDFDANDVYLLPYPVFASYGLSQAESYVNLSWTRLLTVYTDNPTGMYGSSGSAIAVTGRDDDRPLWVIAGDDLPPGSGGRSYGWIDDDTVYVQGSGAVDAETVRIFGVDYALSGLPECLAERFPEAEETLRALWERRLYFARSDRLHQLALDLCAASTLNEEAVAATLAVTLTFTPQFIPNATVTPTPANATPVPPGVPPDCLFDLYSDPGEREAYTALWGEMSAAVPAEAQDELAALLCEGVAQQIEAGNIATGGSTFVSETMWIDAETGLRSMGAPPATLVVRSNPLDLIAPLFEEVFKYPLSTAILSDDRQYLAVSNLPGELTIYQLGFPYERAGLPFTATANAVSTAQNLIYPAVTQGVVLPTQTAQIVGTPRPTLTITPSQTLVPLPNDPVSRAQQHVCPARSLYTPDDLPEGYAATGRIYGFFGDSAPWAIEPEDGQRFEDENAPVCGFGLNCQFSPDRAWILAQSYELVYVVRPDNSDQRVLWDLRTPNPPTPFPQNLRWAAPDVLEWDAVITVGATPTVVPVIARDVLNVYPDPPVVERNPALTVNGILASLISRQPGGDWVVLNIQYGTGTGIGNRYYLYHLGTSETIFFAQHPTLTAQFTWHPYGERLYFSFPDGSFNPPRFEIVFPQTEVTRAHLEGGGGSWSPDGQYTASLQDDEMQVYNAATGERRSFCIPGLSGAANGSALFWSPDSRYLAFVANLRRDDEEHLLVLDTETGAVVDLVRGIYSLITWGQEPGSYGTGAVASPTPTPTMTSTGVG